MSLWKESECYHLNLAHVIANEFSKFLQAKMIALKVLDALFSNFRPDIKVHVLFPVYFCPKTNRQEEW